MTNSTSPTALDREIEVLTDKEVVRWYECGRKKSYRDLVKAEGAADRTMKHDPLDRRGISSLLSAYVCEHCQRYHVGHMRTNGNNLGWDDRVSRAKSAYRRRVVV